jgi:hypothetical protein
LHWCDPRGFGNDCHIWDFTVQTHFDLKLTYLLQVVWMNPSRVVRSTTRVLTDLPNVGPAIAEDLRILGIHTPLDLVGKNPLDLYNRLNDATGTRHDPCVLDVFWSVTDYMAGNDAQPWWAYTKKRKELLARDNPA